ncbi:MAG: hypothetical protein AAGL24_02265 [Pseudomonadota bacterium]
MPTDLHSLLSAQLADQNAGWSIGSFGAIGEFHQRPDDVLSVDKPQDLYRVTDKGGIRLASDRLDAVTAIAFETLSPRPERWGQGVALCLKDDAGRGAQRSVLTELGPDSEALRASDRADILFDMGLAQVQIDFCVRVRDPQLLEVLRAHEGRSLTEPGTSAMGAILKSHPHRVVLSALGRVEIYQKIGGPDTGGVSPDGPHTHVLPKLLRAGRTHSANMPIPDGLLPCAHLYPASPVMGPRGEDIAFRQDRFEAFQTILQTFGRSDYIETKQAVLSALADGTESMLAEPDSRLKRTGLRNALRQQARLADLDADTALSMRISALLQRFDRNAPADDVEEDRPGHQQEGD